MDPEKTLTFCHGLQAEEMTMSLQGLVPTEDATVPVNEIDISTVNKVVVYQVGSGIQPVVSPKYCAGANNSPGYLCETGHCCGETGCCTYYYELWWFWLLWTVLILFSCFCAYRHRRAKLRIQQQQRQREINLIAYNGACNYTSSMLDLSFLTSLKLPSYEEVAAQPSTPPPPYSSIFALQTGAMPGPSSSYTQHFQHHRHPCPPYLDPGPSGMTSSQSTDNYTSCSCESCSLTSPSSTSFSVQVTDETYNSSRDSTPSGAGGDHIPSAPRARVTLTPSSPPPLDAIPAAPDVGPVQRCSSKGSDGETRSLPSHLQLSPLVLLSSNPTADKDITSNPSPNENTKEELNREGLEEEEEEEEDDEDHFRHRRLTGDSGIEMCRCYVRRGGEGLQKGHLEEEGKQIVREGEQFPAGTVQEEQRAQDPSTSSVFKVGDAIITMDS